MKSHQDESSDDHKAPPSLSTSSHGRNITKARLRRFRARNCLKKTFALFFTQVGLLILLVCYTIGGALLFQRIEQKPYYDNLFRKMNNFKLYEVEIIKHAWLHYSILDERDNSKASQSKNFNIGSFHARRTIFNELISLRKDNFSIAKFDGYIKAMDGQLESIESYNTSEVYTQFARDNLFTMIVLLDDFKERVYQAYLSGYRYESQLDHYKDLLDNYPHGEEHFFNHHQKICPNNTVDCSTDEISQNVWSISQSFLFAITVITTIGYGNLVPKTVPGKIATIFYAIFGIPLMLLFLANLGTIMADIVKLSYKTTCFKCTNDYQEDANRRRLKKKSSKSLLKRIIAESERPLDSIVEEDPGPSNKPDEGITNQEGEPEIKPILRRNNQKKGGARTKRHVMSRHSSYIMKAYLRHYEDASDVHNISVPNWLTLVILGGYLLAGAFIYSIDESWTFSDSAYFIFITLTTIGFGDIVPGSSDDRWRPTIQIFLLFYLIIGLAMVAMCFNLMQENVKNRVRKFAKRIRLID